ncbi:MAG: nickel pincer cofactor biosynthesis protein LarB [Pirellulaceae bacterium]
MNPADPNDKPTESPASTAALENWVQQAQSGQLSWTELAERILRVQNPEQAEHHPDRDRQRRCAFSEVIYGSGKSPASIASIARELLEQGPSEVLATRVDEALFSGVQTAAPDLNFRYSNAGRTLRISLAPIEETNQAPCPTPAHARIAIITAGSTDANVGHEALETVRWMGMPNLWLQDIGVAGPYRLLGHLEALRECAAVVVVAGMEGALASVVGGLVPCPVIAVPTSVGYGANFEGITTLLSMLSSCAAGVTAVNIDAGFKGGYIAGLIAHRVAQAANFHSSSND